MSQPPVGRLPASAVAGAIVLLLVPIVIVLAVGAYAKADPALWGIPFFYWYQLLWVILSSAFTLGAYVVIDRARRGPHR
jgi:hypothetical protein